MGQRQSKVTHTEQALSAEVDPNSVLRVSPALLHVIETAAHCVATPEILDLKNAARLAIECLERVKATPGNNLARFLASDACNVVFAALCAWKEEATDNDTPSSSLLQCSAELLEIITKIHRVFGSLTMQGVSSRVVSDNAITDAGNLLNYQRELKNILYRFLPRKKPLVNRIPRAANLGTAPLELPPASPRIAPPLIHPTQSLIILIPPSLAPLPSRPSEFRDNIVHQNSSGGRMPIL